MGKILIFGHKNPDTDSILSALLMEKFDKNLGFDVEAVRLGNVNKETQYVLDYLGIEAPRMIDEVLDGQEVVLVDHNEFAQSVNNIENATITCVVDHHRICDFKTSAPLYYRAEPLGCTASIMYKKYMEENIKIERNDAILMLSAIISDTLLFKSPTCTEEDVKIAKELEKIANINMEEYGLNMLKAGTDLSDLTADELITLDSKEVMLKDVKAKIAQVNTASIPDMLKRKSELENSIANTVNNEGLDLFVLAITDIIESNSQVIVLGKRADLVEKSYNVKLVDNTAFLPGVVSRKKQILPILTENA